MKLIIAFALATSGSVALAQAHDHAPDASAGAPQKAEAAAKPGGGSCPMMDDSHKPQKDRAAPEKGMGMGMGGKGRMGAMAGKGGMPMQESCPMMTKGPQAAIPETGKTTPDRDTDHAEHH
jgi:hypothetical protein